MANPGPTANLKASARRIGRSGTVWIGGRMRGEIVNIEWGREAEQITVPIAGNYRDEQVPGAETGTGTFRYQDVDDYFRLYVWRWFEARRRGDRSVAAEFPEFDVITKIAHMGSPADTRWLLTGCQLFRYDGGFGVGDDLLERDVPFTFREDRPLDAFEYGDNGIVYTRG